MSGVRNISETVVRVQPREFAAGRAFKPEAPHVPPAILQQAADYPTISMVIRFVSGVSSLLVFPLAYHGLVAFVEE
jgi:hypothetical protein